MEPWRGDMQGVWAMMRGTSSWVQAHFLFLKVNRQPAGVYGVMGKKETVMLIRPLHTSPSNNKTKQEWKHGKATDNCGGMGYSAAIVPDTHHVFCSQCDFFHIFYIIYFLP